MSWWLSLDEEKKLYEEKQKYRVICKCGHTNYMTHRTNKKICSWCHNYVFKNPKDEFEYKLKQVRERRLKNERR